MPLQFTLSIMFSLWSETQMTFKTTYFYFYYRPTCGSKICLYFLWTLWRGVKYTVYFVWCCISYITKLPWNGILVIALVIFSTRRTKYWEVIVFLTGKETKKTGRTRSLSGFMLDKRHWFLDLWELFLLSFALLIKQHKGTQAILWWIAVSHHSVHHQHNRSLNM